MGDPATGEVKEKASIAKARVEKPMEMTKLLQELWGIKMCYRHSRSWESPLGCSNCLMYQGKPVWVTCLLQELRNKPICCAEGRWA